MSRSKSKSGGKAAAVKSYPFPTVRVNGVKCHATTMLPAEDELKRIEEKKKAREAK